MGDAMKKLYMIDGQEMTVKEIAAMLGISVDALHTRKYKSGYSYQALVNMYRANAFGNVHDKWPRHYVDGEWITLGQAAERVGVSPKTIRNWMYERRKATGVNPMLAEAVAHYRKYKTGELKRYRGSKGKQYWVKGEYLTFTEAAAKYHTSINSLRMYVRDHRCSLNTAVRKLEERKATQAEKEIIGILFGG